LLSLDLIAALCSRFFRDYWFLLLKTKHFLLHALDLGHETHRYLFECVIQYHWHRISSVLRHNLTMWPMTIKDSKEPIKWLCCLWKRFYNFEWILVYFWSQNLLKLWLLIFLVTRSSHDLFQDHTTATYRTVFKQLVWLCESRHSQSYSGPWPDRNTGVLSWWNFLAKILGSLIIIYLCMFLVNSRDWGLLNWIDNSTMLLIFVVILAWITSKLSSM